jgi:hypothetical protein
VVLARGHLERKARKARKEFLEQVFSASLERKARKAILPEVSEQFFFAVFAGFALNVMCSQKP